MLIKLENANFTAEINTKGAELQNLVRKSDKKDICEYTIKHPIKVQHEFQVSPVGIPIKMQVK